jgi:hypothetical protein
MKRDIFWIFLVAFCAVGNAACGSPNFKLIGTPVVVSGAPATMAVGTTADVSAVVSDGSTSLGEVEWNCTPAASCGKSSFNPDKTASGATTVFTAPATVPPEGRLITIRATVVGKGFVGTSIITITPPASASQNFSFYVNGVASDGEDTDPYNVAGVVMMATDGSGTVLGGEQDYTDGNRIASPQPQGDKIMSGSLAMNADGSGNGTLTLVTNNAKLGVAGTETFAVAFSNANHALITQFDGSATSAGSLDLQTSTARPSGAFSFVVSGSGVNTEAVVNGGVFTVDSGGNVLGTTDTNDGGNLSVGVPIPAGATLSAPDAFGRGTITTDTIVIDTANYYVVGPGVFRIVQTELGSTGVGSAYSQGATPNFSNASIGTSVFSLGASVDFYSAAGQFTTDAGAAVKRRSNSVVPEGSPVTNNFTGVADLNEVFGALLPAATISGKYTLAADGYGSMSFDAGFGDVATVGIYAVDPTLNILDPNNTTNGEGGALIAEMDTNFAGIGTLLPQTDAAPADFTGAYTFGAQGRSAGADGFEFDFLGEATVTAGAFGGTGVLSDPFGTLTGGAVESSSVTFAATAAPDGDHTGRFTFGPLALSSPDFTSPVDMAFTAYQANAGQLFWVQMDASNEAGGSMQQNTLAGAAAAIAARSNNQNH